MRRMAHISFAAIGITTVPAMCSVLQFGCRLPCSAVPGARSPSSPAVCSANEVCVSAQLVTDQAKDGNRVVVVNITNMTAKEIALGAAYAVDDWIPYYQVSGSTAGTGHNVATTDEFTPGQIVCPTPDRPLLVVPPGSTVGRTQRVAVSGLTEPAVELLLGVRVFRFADTHRCGPVEVMRSDITLSLTNDSPPTDPERFSLSHGTQPVSR